MILLGNPFFILGLYIAGMVLMLFFFVLFSGVEYALLASNPLTLELKRDQKSQPKNSLGKLLDQPDLFWKTTTAALVLLTVSITLLTYYFLDFVLKIFPDIRNFKMYFLKYPYMLMILTGLLVLILVYLSKRIIAKSIFERKPENKVNGLSNWIVGWSTVLNPMMVFFKQTSEQILILLFNVRVKKGSPIFTGVNTDIFFKQSIQGHNVLEKLNKKLVHGAIDLTQISVRSCITPRNEIEAISIDAGMDEVRKKFLDSKVSKLIVFQKHMDKILGYIHHMDLNKHPENIDSILLPLPAVPEAMSALELVRMFTRERKSMALVVDEFGGTSGVVTMDDILEEIFGSIMDEYDSEELVEKKLDDNEYVFSGRLKLDYLINKYGFSFPNASTETLSGYIINRNEAIPEQKQKIIIGKYEFEILLVTDTKIESVRMKVLLH